MPVVWDVPGRVCENDGRAVRGVPDVGESEDGGVVGGGVGAGADLVHLCGVDLFESQIGHGRPRGALILSTNTFVLLNT